MQPISAGEVISLAVAARRLAASASDHKSAFTPKAVHAARVAEQATPRVPHPCPMPMSAREYGAFRQAAQVSTSALPDTDLGVPLLRKSQTAIACLVDGKGGADVVVEAAKIVNAFCRSDDQRRGQMVLDALELLRGDSPVTWGFRQGLGVDDHPERIIQDLNVTQRVADWLGASASWDIGSSFEGFHVSLREEADWKTSGVQLNLEYFASMGQALAIAVVIYCFAKRVGLTQAWIRDL